MFMKEFPVIDSASSVDQLRRRLKAEELEQFGLPFTPDFIYDAIRKLPRFDGMRRGHQQDAEEFLGFLLESLHEECAHVIRAAFGGAASSMPVPAPVQSPRENGAEADGGWLEVGHKQRAAVTRSSGQSQVSTPITKIFGGQLRSELRVPGLKDSVTLEPYQPLQLDIQSPNVRNIVDALKGLTRPETLHGDFNSPRGKDVTATKTVYIESLPPVLILHLKRFQFDAEGNGGTVKIWKKVGYPLELEIPREVFSRQKRNSVLAEGGGLPRYKLITVVYHHGKNASGGHYTVDVRRQDGREWIRLDDTVIRRVHADDVAEGGAEEKDGSRTPDSVGRRDNGGSVTPSAIGNRFSGMGSDSAEVAEDAAGEDEDAGEWKQVNNGSSTGGHGKKWSSVVNGASVAGATAGGAGAPTAKGKAQAAKENVRDNKVAYLLFYQRV
jgi:ubiquitin carboxyl-terminal hydrolase 10